MICSLAFAFYDGVSYLTVTLGIVLMHKSGGVIIIGYVIVSSLRRLFMRHVSCVDIKFCPMTVFLSSAQT